MSDKTATLLCLHFQELFVGKVGGVYHYSHSDGSSCTPYNSFVTSNAEILYTIGKSYSKESPALRAAFLTSQKLRLEYYKTIARQTEKESLLRWLHRAYALMKDSYNEYSIAGELEWCFGQVVWENFSLFTQEQYSVMRMSPQDHTYLPHMTDEKYPMINIKNRMVDNTFLDIDQELAARKERYKKTPKY